MNWLDVVLLIALAGSAAASLRKGLTRDIIGFVAVIVALLLGTWFYGTVASYLVPYISSRWAANLAGFVLYNQSMMIDAATFALRTTNGFAVALGY